jgi:ankyrin repeat protein
MSAHDITLATSPGPAATFERAPRRGARVAWLLAATLLVAATANAAPGSSGLAEAARRGDVAAVRTLLKADTAKDDLAAQTADNMTPLLYAAQSNDLAMARLLLDAGADPNLANLYGVTPLWLAATNASAPFVELLLKHGANAAGALPSGETPLMAAARAGDAVSIDLLIKAGADPNAAQESQGETALMWAAAENHAEAIRALAKGGAMLDAHSKTLNLAPMNWLQIGMVSTVLPIGGWTAPMYAARQDAKDAIRALAEVGADLSSQDPDGTTPLIVAIMNAHYDLAAELLEVGADPNVADRTGTTPLYTAVDMVTLGRVIGRPEEPRVDKLDALGFIKVLLAKGANPNATLTAPAIARYHGFPDRSLGAGATALMRAAKGYDVDSMRILLDAGADPKLTQADGSSVLSTFAGGAPQRGEKDTKTLDAMRATLQLILDAGIDINSQIKVGATEERCRGALCGPAGAKQGETALHKAARQGNVAMVTLLVEHGADPDIRDAAGKSPLDIVTEPGRSKNDVIAAILKRPSDQK